jgi:competence protein CoiA
MWITSRASPCCKLECPKKLRVHLQVRYAIINDERSEATKGAKGECPSCGAEMIARCGELRVDHWAHKGRRHCDTWWENETDWHRAWKDEFPKEWQEVIHYADDGEKHIADVKTPQGWVLEFQHSAIKSEERMARTEFYPKLVWIVDGTRRKNDYKQFFSDVADLGSLDTKPPIQKIFKGFSRLLSEWDGLSSPVFVDFGHLETNPDALWCLLPIRHSHYFFVVRFKRSEFIRIHRSGIDTSTNTFERFFDWSKQAVAKRMPWDFEGQS